MYTSAVLALKPTGDQHLVLETAITLAQRQSWQLSAVSVVDLQQAAPPEPVPMGAGAFKVERDEAAQQAAREGAAHVIAQCVEIGAARGISVAAGVCEGKATTEISQLSALHDLLIVGHNGGDEPSEHSLLWHLAKQNPRPTLIIPRVPITGDDVLIAYDGSYQAARTLASFAYSGLAAARKVTVFSCHAQLPKAEVAAEEARTFLEKHGITATLRAEQGSSPANAILHRAAEASCGLLVMGAFGQLAVREFLLGSVTRSVLRQLQLPLFLDH